MQLLASQIKSQAHYGAHVHRPPHYHYSYQVLDPLKELQFGQEEDRKGDFTKGRVHKPCGHQGVSENCYALEGQK